MPGHKILLIGFKLDASRTLCILYIEALESLLSIYRAMQPSSAKVHERRLIERYCLVSKKSL